MPRTNISDTDKRRARSFDQVADLYNQARPSYPNQLATDLLSFADMPGSILEVGSGTGKATVLFAPFGYPLTCLEPGEPMAALAAQNLRAFPNVQIVQSTFEDWVGPQESFALLISAQAFHWLDRKIVFAKAASLLKPGGAIGVFWNRADDTDALYRPAFEQAYAQHAPEIASPASLEDWIAQQQQEIESSGFFGSVLVRQYPWSQTYDTEAYLAMLSTHSDHILLAEEQRHALYQALRAEIERLGGRITRKYVAVLFLAKRL